MTKRRVILSCPGAEDSGGRAAFAATPQQIMAFSEPISELRDALTHADRSPEHPQEALASNKGNAEIGEKKKKKESRTHSTFEIDYFTSSKTHTWG